MIDFMLKDHSRKIPDRFDTGSHIFDTLSSPQIKS